MLGRFKHLAIIFLTAFHFAAACASGLQVDPINLQLTAQQPVTSLHLSNQGTRPLLVEAQLYRWQQKNGQDIYTKTQDLLVTPPIVNIPVGQERLIRIGLLGKTFPPKQEQAYRLYVQEVVTTKQKMDMSPDSIMIALRIGLPVFVEPLVSTASPALVWKLQSNYLVARNEGQAHVKIMKIELFQGLKKITQIDTFEYLLPGQTYRWALKKNLTSLKSMRLIITTDQGEQPPTMIS